MKLNWEDSYKMPEEYDLSKLKRVPNPISQKLRDLNLVSLEEDVKSVFPDSQAVNEAWIDSGQRPVGQELKKAS